MTGLSAATVARLERAIATARDGWLLDLIGARELSEAMTDQIARLVFEGLEVVEKEPLASSNFDKRSG